MEYSESFKSVCDYLEFYFWIFGFPVTWMVQVNNCFFPCSLELDICTVKSV